MTGLQEAQPGRQQFADQCSLVAGDVLQFQGTVDHQHADDRQAHGDFVGDHLRRAAHAAEQGKFVVRRPGADDDAVDAERTHGEDVKNADVEIGDLQD